MSIATRLDSLASVRNELEAAELEAASYIPEDIQSRVDSLRADVKDSEAELKQAAKHINVSARHTLRGRILQLVHTSKVSYPKAKIEAEVPEKYLSKIRKTADVWSIRKAA